MQKELERKQPRLRRSLGRELLREHRKHQSLGLTSPEAVDKTLSVIAGILLDTSSILRIPVPTVEFFFKTDETESQIAEVTGHVYDDSLRIRIELGYFMYQTHRLDSSSEEPVIRQLKTDLGEEMYHVYVAQRFPATDERTRTANELGGIVYEQDRGERIAKRFGERYANRTLPDIWKKRIREKSAA